MNRCNGRRIAVVFCCRLLVRRRRRHGIAHRIAEDAESRPRPPLTARARPVSRRRLRSPRTSVDPASLVEAPCGEALGRVAAFPRLDRFRWPPTIHDSARGDVAPSALDIHLRQPCRGLRRTATFPAIAWIVVCTEKPRCQVTSRDSEGRSRAITRSARIGQVSRHDDFWVMRHSCFSAESMVET